MLVFDGDCGFCSRYAYWIAARLPADVEVVPWQTIDDLEAIGLTERDVECAAWWVNGRDGWGRGRRDRTEPDCGFWRLAAPRAADAGLAVQLPLTSRVPLGRRQPRSTAGSNPRLPGRRTGRLVEAGEANVR